MKVFNLIYVEFCWQAYNKHKAQFLLLLFVFDSQRRQSASNSWIIDNSWNGNAARTAVHWNIMCISIAIFHDNNSFNSLRMFKLYSNYALKMQVKQVLAENAFR